MPPPTASRSTGRRGQAVPVAMTLLSISSVQLGDALSLSAVGAVGPAGTAWLRTGLGALLLLAVVRPRVRSLGVRQLLPVCVLGVLTAALSLSFLAALERLPLGTAVAIEFLGPLGVAVARAGRSGLVWPGTALLGVLALTQPWQGSTSLTGVLLALAAAAAWAGCILATSEVGSQVPGLDGTALALPVAALVLAPWGAPHVLPHLDRATVGLGLVLAVLMPVLPCALELVALRRLHQGTFATLMALEPALAALVGLVVLGQGVTVLSGLGVLLVVVAGLGATAADRQTPTSRPAGTPPAPAARPSTLPA